MKTIDEVITALTACTYSENVDCEHCVYYDPSKDMDGKNCDDYAIPQMQVDALHYLKILKAKSEEPPDYIPLNFHRLAEMIGEPVYVKDSGCKGRWEIVMSVRKTADGEDVCFRGCDRWQMIGKTIYRTKEGAGK